MRTFVAALCAVPNGLMLMAFSLYQGWYDTGRVDLYYGDLVLMAAVGWLLTFAFVLLGSGITGRLGFRSNRAWQHIAIWAVISIVILDAAYGLGTFILVMSSPVSSFSFVQSILLSGVLSLFYLLMIAPFGAASGCVIGILTWLSAKALSGSSSSANRSRPSASDWAA